MMIQAYKGYVIKLLVYGTISAQLTITEAFLMWTAPPPAWNQTNAGNTPTDIQTAVYPVRNGSTNVLLRWNYKLLPGQTLLLTTFSIGDGISQDDIGLVIGGPTGTPADKYKDRFSIYSTSQFSNLTINMVTVQDNATFQCKLQVGANAWAYNIRVEVTDPAIITHISGNQTVNETEVVEQICSAEGMPTPSISWTRVSDNSPVFFPLTITGKQDEEGYRCIAENGVGNPASQVLYIIVENYHPIDTNLMTSFGGNSVVVNMSFNITCSAQANPPAKYKFYKDQVNFVNDTTGSDVSVITTLVSERRKKVNYSCTPFNYFGDGLTDGLTLTVLYAPSSTNLKTVPNNTTLLRESNISLHCSTDANPDAHIYLFYLNDNLIGNSSSGVFNTTVMADGVYTCVPVNTVGIEDNASASITVVDPPSITIHKIRDTIEEGENITLTCHASGKPQPVITWTKPGSSEVLSNTSSLTIVNVSRPGTPDNMIQYQCTASNGVGTPATDIISITVHYQPEDVHLTTNATDKVCLGIIINFTCSAEADPAVHTYLLYENDNVIYNMAMGTVTKTMENAGQFVFRCEANNSVQDTGRSSDTILTVLAPAATVKQTENEITVEGTDIEVNCDVTGIPDPTVTWRNVKSGEIIEGNLLNITNITRAQAGEYKCTANNTCGVDSKMVNINVQYPPTFASEGDTIDVSEGDPVSVSCPVLGNPQPNITWYKGNDTSPSTVINSNIILHFPETALDNSGWYTCFAENYLGNITATVQLHVETFVPTTVTTLPKPTTKAVESTISARATIDESCDERLDVEKRFPSLACERVRHLGCLSAQAVASRCGSVIVDFEMKFNQNAVVSEVLNVLKTAAEKDNFDGFKVDPNSIEQASPPPTDTSGTKAAEECKCSCNDVILAAVVGVLVFVIIGLILYIVWLHKKGTAGRQRHYKEERDVYDNEMALDDLQPSSHIPSKSTQSRSEYMDITEATRHNEETQRVAHSTDYAPLHPLTRSWEVEKQHVTIEKIIGKGAFGQVAKGTATGLLGRPGKTTVAVKMLKYNSPESDRRDLLRELDTMQHLKPHPHVIKLLGCVTETEPLMVIIEYVPYGDLLGYLRKSRGLNDTYYKDPDIKPQTSLNSQQLMKFAWQIADGMSYLSSKSIIHRDLAARNVLVGERETCKVTDFGMARDVQQDNIYEKKTKGRLPVKWTAYEALLYGTYTTKSDIWSYGVVLYEIFTIGGSPYPRVNGKRIASLLQEGYRMPKPQHVDDKLYAIMLKCWQNDPDVRPTFSELKNQLKDMENQHKRLINLKLYDHRQLYANVEDLVE